MSSLYHSNNFLQLSFLNGKEILSRSSGEILNSNTVDLKKGPIKGGLFCTEIFGSEEFFECKCNRTKLKHFSNKICPFCKSRLVKNSRRTRIAHIEFEETILHPWFFFQNPNYYKFLFHPFNDLTNKVEKIQSYNNIKLKKKIKKKVIQKRYYKISPFLIWPEKRNNDLKKNNFKEGISLYSKPYQIFNTFWVQSSIEGWKTNWSKYPIQLERKNEQTRLKLEDVQKWTNFFLNKEFNLSQTINCIKFKTIYDNHLYLDYHVRSKKMKESFVLWRKTPEGALMKYLPIIPPDLRPILQLSNNLYVSSDINQFYRIIIEKNSHHPFNFKSPLKKNMDSCGDSRLLNNKLYESLESRDSEDIMKTRELQYWIFHLFHNEKSKSPITKIGSNLTSPYTSLQQRLKGKSGRYRFNLLGKRVNYSGRSVIIPNPQLMIHEIELPKFLVIELFKPFLKNHFLKLNKTYKTLFNLTTKKDFKLKRKDQIDSKFIEIGLKYIKESSLYELIEKHFILVNRAPTLHRMNIQSFLPKITSKVLTIGLHPLICASFNADFDGDQMAVYLPITNESQSEAINLLSSIENIYSPNHGKTLLEPSLDIVLGIYFATIQLKESQVKDYIFKNMQDIQNKLELKQISLQDPIQCYIESIELKKNIITKKSSLVLEQKLVRTTPGRALFYTLLKKVIFVHLFQKVGLEGLYNEKKIQEDKPFFSFTFWNKEIGKSNFRQLLNQVSFKNSKEFLVVLMQILLNFGLKHAYWSGLSFSIRETKSNPYKDQLLNHIEKKLKNINDLYHYKYLLSYYTFFLEQMVLPPVKYMEKKTNPSDALLHLGVYSGARGSYLQLRQITSSRGFMSKPDGSITSHSIQSNLKDGLTLMNYFQASHGSRKGIIDTSIKTAAAGYLTRKLVNSAQSLIINLIDCKTTEGIIYNTSYYSNSLQTQLFEKIEGKIILTDVYNINNKLENKPLISKGTILGKRELNLIERHSVESILARSPITCKSINGICSMCYGLDLSTNKLPSLGHAVGVIAGQSIGEPGTQLTMRTFHTGGATLSTKDMESTIYSTTFSIVLFEGICNTYMIDESFESFEKKRINRKEGYLYLLSSQDYSILDRHLIPYGAEIHVNEGDCVEKNTKIISWNSNKAPIFSYEEGYFESSKNHDFFSRYSFFSSISLSFEKKITSPILYKKIEYLMNDIKTFALNLVQMENDSSRIFKNWYYWRINKKKQTKNHNDVPNLNDPMNVVMAYLFKQILQHGRFDLLTFFFQINFYDNFSNKITRIICLLFETYGFLSYLKIYDRFEEDFFFVKEDQIIYFGQILGERPRSFSRTKDITGEIAEVTRLFDVQQGTNGSIVSPISGHLNFVHKNLSNSKIVLKINSIERNKNSIYIEANNFLQVRAGDFIRKGDLLTYGSFPMFQMSYYKGPFQFYKFIFSEIQKIYLHQGISVNEKHLEVIFKSMLDIFFFKKNIDGGLKVIKNVNPISYLSNSFFENRLSNNFNLDYKILQKNIQGINEISTNQSSWLASAAFERLQNVLIHSTFFSKVDRFKGPFERTMPGKLILSGSGFSYFKKLNKNISNDELIKNYYENTLIN